MKKVSVSHENTTYEVFGGSLYSKKRDKLIYYVSDASNSNVFLPPGVVEICDTAFAGCNNIVSVVLPQTVERIGEFAFAACRNLSSLCFSSDSRIKTVGYAAFTDCIQLKRINFPETITEITEFAFCGCANLKEVVFSPNSSLKSIGDDAFGHTHKDMKVENLPTGLVLRNLHASHQFENDSIIRKSNDYLLQPSILYKPSAFYISNQLKE